MLLVLVFLALLLSLFSVGYRHAGSALRIEKTRLLQRHRDEGGVAALARGVTLLETGAPPTDPYVCGVTIETSVGPCDFTVTMSSEGEDQWSVHVAPTQWPDSPPPMPPSFAEVPGPPPP
jgi:hypothetical protein